MFEHLTADKLSELSEEEILAAAAQLKETIQCAESALSLVKAEMTKRVDSFDLSPTLAFNGWVFRLKMGNCLPRV